MAYSWLRPQGSKREGISSRSTPAVMRCAIFTLNPTQPRHLSWLRASMSLHTGGRQPAAHAQHTHACRQARPRALPAGRQQAPACWDHQGVASLRRHHAYAHRAWRPTHTLLPPPRPTSERPPGPRDRCPAAPAVRPLQPTGSQRGRQGVSALLGDRTPAAKAPTSWQDEARPRDGTGPQTPSATATTHRRHRHRHPPTARTAHQPVVVVPDQVHAFLVVQAPDEAHHGDAGVHRQPQLLHTRQARGG